MALAERLQIPLRDTAATHATRGCSEDGDTFAELVQRYDRTVHNVIRAMVHNPQDVEDVSQEVWIKVANNLANLRDQSRFLPWLYRISRNCALNFLSTQKNRQCVANTDEDDQVEALASPVAEGPEAQAISVAERREVWAALAALSDADRTVLLLREFHELPYADIASQLHISRGNAEVRVFRARSRFRQQFTRREGTMARGFLGMPLFGLLGKLRLVFGASGAASTSTASTATVATAAVATTGTSVAAEVGIGFVAKLMITVAALSVTAGAVSVAPPAVAPEDVSAPVSAAVTSAGALAAPYVAVTSAVAPVAPHVAVTSAVAPVAPHVVATTVDSRPVTTVIMPKALTSETALPVGGATIAALAPVTLLAQPAMVPPSQVSLQSPLLTTTTTAVVVASSTTNSTPTDATVSASSATTSTDASTGLPGRGEANGIGARNAGGNSSANANAAGPGGNNGQDKTSSSDHGNSSASATAAGPDHGNSGANTTTAGLDHGNSGANTTAAGLDGRGGQNQALASDHGNSSANASVASPSGNSGQGQTPASDHGNSGEATVQGRGTH